MYKIKKYKALDKTRSGSKKRDFIILFQGGGRKILDQKMEKELSNWWINEIMNRKVLIPLSVIKQRARKNSNFKDQFKASKGWLDKFIKRYQIQEKIQEIMNNNVIKDKSEYKLDSNKNLENKNEIFQESSNDDINRMIQNNKLDIYQGVKQENEQQQLFDQQRLQ